MESASQYGDKSLYQPSMKTAGRYYRVEHHEEEECYEFKSPEGVLRKYADKKEHYGRVVTVWDTYHTEHYTCDICLGAWHIHDPEAIWKEIPPTLFLSGNVTYWPTHVERQVDEQIT